MFLTRHANLSQSDTAAVLEKNSYSALCKELRPRRKYRLCGNQFSLVRQCKHQGYRRLCAKLEHLQLIFVRFKNSW